MVSSYLYVNSAPIGWWRTPAAERAGLPYVGQRPPQLWQDNEGHSMFPLADPGVGGQQRSTTGTASVPYTLSSGHRRSGVCLLAILNPGRCWGQHRRSGFNEQAATDTLVPRAPRPAGIEAIVLIRQL